MTEPVWIDGSTTAGKYPEKAFDAVLKAMYPGMVGKEQDKPALKLDFEGDLQLAIFGIDQIDKDGHVPAFMDIGKFLDSLTALKVKYQWGVIEGEIIGIKTDPDLVGCKLSMKPTERAGDVGSQYEGKTFRSWTLEKFEKVEKKKDVDVTTTKKAPAPELADTVLAAVKTPKTIKEVFEGLGKKYKVSEIRGTLEQLEADGFTKKDGEKYVAA